MRSDYWGQGSHNALLLVGDFFRQASARRLIDPAARFPGERETWFGAALFDWIGRLFHGSAQSGRETPLDAVEGWIAQVRDSIERVQRQWEALQRLIDRISRVFS
jgi:penicillin-binding protein 1A